jgi:hypothetical protein
MNELFKVHPTPWKFDDNREGYEGALIAYDATGLVVICTGDMEGCSMVEIELAQLIAAAPDLLAELRAALAWWDNVPKTINAMKPVWVEYARKAIAKAEGPR